MNALPYSQSSARRRGSLFRCCAIILAVWCGCLVGCDDTPIGITAGRRAPDIVGKDATGKPIKLTDYRGKVVLVDFWATWCGPCLTLIPEEKELLRIYGKRGLVILGINRDSEGDLLLAITKKGALPWDNIHDPEGTITRAWAIESLPSWVLVDDQGKIRGRWKGGENFPDVKKAVDEAIRIKETR